MNGNIIYFSRCNNNPSGNGGDKRVAQICDILNCFDYKFVTIYDQNNDMPHKFKKILCATTGFVKSILLDLYKLRVTYLKYYKWNECYRRHVFSLHVHSRIFIDRIQTKPRLLIVDDPVFVAPVVKYAKAYGIPIVAFSQNIETLSREQVEYTSQLDLFRYEIDLFSKCDLVITISTEETYLLKNFGMDPVYLPYFPLKQTAERFEVIRRKRIESDKHGFLLLGTVHNLPTLDGMKRVIAAMLDNAILPDERLIVAGYGTKQLLGYLNHHRIEVRGDVTDADLDGLLTATKGCIVYQETGSGALTKIPELLLAGVPVIINSHAARSHHNLPGIFEFTTFDELAGQMRAAAALDRFSQVLTPPDPAVVQARIAGLLRAC